LTMKSEVQDVRRKTVGRESEDVKEYERTSTRKSGWNDEVSAVERKGSPLGRKDMPNI